MKTSSFILFCLSIALARADVIETAGGKLTGKVTKSDADSVTIATDYAGTITVKRSAITNMTTDAPVPPPPPWSYEAAADITGKTGNSEQLGTSGSVRATRRTDRDALQLYAAYDRQITDHLRSADQLKLGIDYQDNFAGRTSWYTRDEGGFDRVKDIEFDNVAAAGLGFDLFREPKHILTARIGVSYRTENYRNPATSDVHSAGLDIGLNHEMTFGDSKLVNRIAYVPAFDDFGDFRLTHESFYELPLAKSAWKLRTGVSNDYNSHPGPGLERMDTTYFSRLVLTWN